MRSKQLYKEVEVTVVTLDSAIEGLHKHHFFQIIYVLEGSGIHSVNENRFPFGKGDVFLLTPEDAHSYEVVSPPVFCIIDFTKNFFFKTANSREEKVDISDAFKRLEYIFHNQHNAKGSLILDSDKHIFESLINQLILEKQNEGSFSKIIKQNIIFLLLNFIARDIQQRSIGYPQEGKPQNKIQIITAYIQQHIYDKELLFIKRLAEQFNMSEGHLSRYFKQETGDTLKNYITRYKLDIIQTRLKFSDHTISQIAVELNFTDESHLNKVFKSAFGLTPKQFKMAYKQVN
jgi:AraC family L-rhamnose operon regulatory protein RhaS